MSGRDNKLAILRRLVNESEPISLPDLLCKLGDDFKERTVRRWLSELIQKGVIRKIGQKRGTKYLVRGRQEEQIRNGASSCFSSASLQSIEHVKSPLFERKPVCYAEDWLESYQALATTISPHPYESN